MIYTSLTKKAIILCFTKHKDQLDKSGLPYVFHPFHVAESMTDEITTCVALLHDVLEDTPTTADELLNMGFPKEVVNAVKKLSHPEEVDYLDYIRSIKSDAVCRAVKLADLKHNSDLTRLCVISQKDLDRVEKYKKAIKILEQE